MSRRRLLVIGAVVVVAVGAFAALYAVRAASGPAGYDEAGVRENFMAACTADGGDPVRDTCTCVWDALVVSVPFDRFTQVDEQLAPQASADPGTPLELPDDIGSLVQRCAEQA